MILKLELALFAADANRPMKVKAIPYWDQSLDSDHPEGRWGDHGGSREGLTAKANVTGNYIKELLLFMFRRSNSK